MCNFPKISIFLYEGIFAFVWNLELWICNLWLCWQFLMGAALFRLQDFGYGTSPWAIWVVPWLEALWNCKTLWVWFRLRKNDPFCHWHRQHTRRYSLPQIPRKSRSLRYCLMNIIPVICFCFTIKLIPSLLSYYYGEIFYYKQIGTCKIIILEGLSICLAAPSAVCLKSSLLLVGYGMPD